MRSFLRTLFFPGETVCASSSTYGTAIITQDQVSENHCYISINPLEISRADAHCTAFRNYLIEIDKIPLDNQKKYIDGLEMPYSTMVYSGNKSYHFVIALEQSITRKEYGRLGRWLHQIVEKADHSTRNPSRFTRNAGGIHVKTKNEQHLLKVNGRIPNKTFTDWLKIYPQFEPRQQIALTRRYFSPGDHGVLSPYTQEFLMQGAPEGMRNNRLYAAACDFALNNYSLQEAFNLLSQPLMHYEDINVSTCIETIKSAYRRFKS